jgi:hypothetical protein
VNTSEMLPYAVGGCVCLMLLLVIAGAIGGMLFARKRREPVPAVIPTSTESSPELSPLVTAQGISTDLHPVLTPQENSESSPKEEDMMTSDLNVTIVNRPADDLKDDLKATLVHRAIKEEEKDDNASTV